MTTPTTAAGRAQVAEWPERRPAVLAIEAEAAAPALLLDAALRRLVAALEDARVAADDALDRAGSAADAFEQGTMRPDALDELHDAEDAARVALAATDIRGALAEALPEHSFCNGEPYPEAHQSCLAYADAILAALAAKGVEG